jgi:hypothetical protein
LTLAKGLAFVNNRTRALESIAVALVVACFVSICLSFSFASFNLFNVFKLQQTMSLPLDLRNFFCFSRHLRQAMFLQTTCIVTLLSCSKQLVSSLSAYHLLTRMSLALHLALQRTYSEQQPEFSLSDTTYLRLHFLYLKHKNISKLVCLI